MTEQQPGALSKAEAVAYLGGAPITVNTLDGLVRRREIGFARVGRATVFPVAALDAYLALHTTAPEQRPWGLTEASLRSLQSGRLTRGKKAAS